MAVSFSKTPISLKVETAVKMDGTVERSVMAANGTIYVKDETTVLAYEEISEGGPVNTLIKIRENFASITRSGAIAMRQRFIPGQTTEGTYKTPYGTLQVKAETKEIRLKWERDTMTGVLLLAYDLELEGSPVGFYTIKLEMEEA